MDGSPSLPVLPTIARGYREVLDNIGAYSLQALLWAIAAGALEYLLDDPGPDPRHLGRSATPWAVAAHYAGPFAELIVMLLGNVAIGVSVYRALIRNELPAWRRWMRFGRRELRFLGLSLTLFVLQYGGILALLLIALFGAHAIGEARWAQRVLAVTGNSVAGQFLITVVASALASATIVPFFGLAFPLAAIDAPASLLLRAARLGRGCRIRLGAISFLAMLPFTVASFLPSLAWTPAPGTVAFSVRDAGFALITLLGVAFATAAFAAAFRIVADRHSTGVYAVFD